MRSARKRGAGRVLVSVAILATAACGDDSATGVPQRGPARRPTLTIVSGNAQTAEVGTLLPQPLVVVLRDTLGDGVPGTFVQFHPEGAGPTDSAQTDAAGRASVQWTLGGTAGTQRVFARAEVVSIVQATITARGIAGPVATVRLSVVNAVALPRTQLDTVYARVADRFGNPISAAPVAWAVELGGGSVRALTNQTDLSGRARAMLTLGPSVGDHVLSATSSAFTDRLTAFASTAFPATSVAVGSNHSCAIAPTGEAYCWGSSSRGQLGATQTVQLVPVRVGGGLRLTSLVAGAFHTCGLTAAGEAYCWGSNEAGALGAEVPTPAPPTRVAGNHTFTALAAGYYHTCGLTSAATILCWGDNLLGQRGDGSSRAVAQSTFSTRQVIPSPVVGGHSFVALAASNSSTCGITRGGETYCWGSNLERELGTGVAGECVVDIGFYYPEPTAWSCSTAPVRVTTPGPLTSITAGSNSICGVTTGLELVCWGNGAAQPRVVTSSVVTNAWVLGDVACVLADRAVSCWSLSGPAGVFLPRNPFGDGPALVGLSSSGSTTCGLTRQQPALTYCWGSNDSGQLGDGTLVFRGFPVPVVLPPPTPQSAGR